MLVPGRLFAQLCLERLLRKTLCKNRRHPARNNNRKRIHSAAGLQSSESQHMIKLFKLLLSLIKLFLIRRSTGIPNTRFSHWNCSMIEIAEWYSGGTERTERLSTEVTGRRTNQRIYPKAALYILYIIYNINIYNI